MQVKVMKLFYIVDYIKKYTETLQSKLKSCLKIYLLILKLMYIAYLYIFILI